MEEIVKLSRSVVRIARLFLGFLLGLSRVDRSRKQDAPRGYAAHGLEIAHPTAVVRGSFVEGRRRVGRRRIRALGRRVGLRRRVWRNAIARGNVSRLP